jgi:hypothetical protein
MDSTTTVTCALCGTGESTGKRVAAAPGRLHGAETCLSCETLLDKLSTGHMSDAEFDVLAGHVASLDDSELGRQIGNMLRVPVEAPVVPTAAAAMAPVESSKVQSLAAVVIASVWMIASILIGMTFIRTDFEVYGGDAYTGIQNAVVVATRALGWIIIGTGVLGLVIAMERKVTRS